MRASYQKPESVTHYTDEQAYQRPYKCHGKLYPWRLRFLFYIRYTAKDEEDDALDLQATRASDKRMSQFM